MFRIVPFYFPFRFISLIMLLMLGNHVKIYSQIESLWWYGGDIGSHNLEDFGNIDGDEYLDRLIYEKANNKIKYLAWQPNTANRIGIIHMVDLPLWPVWACGVIDIDQDNDGDLLMTHATSGDLYVCYQLCPSEFEEPILLDNVTAQYGAFKIHDANGDGIQDLVGPSYNEPFQYYMQHGLGDGEFGPLKALFIGWTEIFARRFQDLDSDGYSDIMVTTGSGSRIVYYPGQESGGWGSERTVITGISDPWSSAIGDIDGDGHKDVIVSNFTGTNQPVYIAHNNGDNTFEKEILFSSLLATTLLECADINHDGKAEILLGGTNGADVWLYRNNGNYNFTTEKLDDMYHPSGNFTDYDNDGILDIFLHDVTFYPERYYWWKGSVDGISFEPKGKYLPVNGSFPTVFIGNFSKDSIPDEMIVRYNFGELDLYLAEGYGDGRFKEERLIKNFSSTGGIQSVDHNNDGKVDILTNSTGKLYFNRNTGNGNLAPPILLAEDVGIYVMLDVKRDGYTDFLYQKGNSDTLILLSFEKTGPSSTIIFGSALPLMSMATEDFNGDGFPDIGLTSTPEDRIDIYINRIHSFEKLYSTMKFSGAFHSLKAMDFDWDGIQDILLIVDKQIHWLKGALDGTYGDPQLIPLNGFISSFTLSDVVGDAQLEVIVTRSDAANGYYIVESPGTLSTRKKLFATGDRIGILADINLDNRIDGAVQLNDSTIVWVVSHQESDFPYILSNMPCDSSRLVKVSIVQDCEMDFTIYWQDGTVGNQHPGLSEGIHTYYVVQNNDTVKTVTIPIHIDPLRISQLTISDDDGMAGGGIDIELLGGSPPYAVSWRSAGNTIGNTLTNLPAGNYWVNVTDAKGCSLDTLITISLKTNIEFVTETDFLSVYPSPARDVIFIENHEEAVELISIVQPDGKTVHASARLEPGEVFTMNITDCAQGVLYLQYRRGNGLYTVKFLKL